MSRRKKYQDYLDGGKYAMKCAVSTFNNILLDNRIEQSILHLFNAWTYILIATCIKNKKEYVKDKKDKNDKFKSAEEMFLMLQTKDNKDGEATYQNFSLI